MRVSRIIATAVLVLASVTMSAQGKGYEKSLEVNGGVGVDRMSKYSFGLTMINGYRLSDTFMVGLGTGYELFDALYSTSHEYLGRGNSISDGSYSGKSLIRLFGRLKWNLTTTKVSPFLQGDIGCSMDLNGNEWSSASGLMFEPAFGIDFAMEEGIKMYAALGYHGQNTYYTGFNLTLGNSGSEKYEFIGGLFDVKVGIKF